VAGHGVPLPSAGDDDLRTGGLEGYASLEVAPDLADDARRTLAELAAVAIDLDETTQRLLNEGVEAFELAMSGLLASIERRRADARR
jgi:transaldolase